LNLATMPYEAQIGLWLNVPRVRLQKAIEVCRGIEVALTEGELDTAWYDALCLLEEQVAEVEFTDAAARNRAQAKSHW